MKRNIIQTMSIALLVSFLIVFIINISPVYADEVIDSAKIFTANCAGCHLNGGNIVRRGKNLKLTTLEKNGFDNVAAIAQLVTNGKNNMSAYKDRLSTGEIQAVSEYVLTQAKNGWK